MAEKKQQDVIKGIKVGKKYKMRFVTQSITPNGKQRNQFVYDVVDQLKDGSYKKKARFFIQFWGTYEKEEEWLKDGGTVLITGILGVAPPVWGKSKTTNDTYLCQYITVTIATKRTDVINTISTDSTANDGDDDYYYGGKENKAYYEKASGEGSISYPDDEFD